MCFATSAIPIFRTAGYVARAVADCFVTVLRFKIKWGIRFESIKWFTSAIIPHCGGSYCKWAQIVSVRTFFYEKQLLIRVNNKKINNNKSCTNSAGNHGAVDIMIALNLTLASVRPFDL